MNANVQHRVLHNFCFNIKINDNEMRKFKPQNNDLCHVFNRGTEKRNVFAFNKDYERFIVNLILFNTQQIQIKNISRYDVSFALKNIPDDPLVKIHAFCLMLNHFHFILEQITDNGISRFLHKLEMGYSKYFNKMYPRNGNLFQGAYKISHIDNDSYRLYIPLYIHLNALELLKSERFWKEKGIKDKAKAFNFLRNYPWSSLRAYLNIESLPFISHDILNELYENPKTWEIAIKDWLPEYVQHSVLHNWE